MSNHHARLPDPMLLDCDWHDLVRAATAAGRRSAAELARNRTPERLARTGTVTIHIEPGSNPVAGWLCRHGEARLNDDQTVSLPIRLTPSDLGPIPDAVRKANALLVRHAYAAAFATVLTDEAGVSTSITLHSHGSRSHSSRRRRRAVAVSTAASAPS